MTRLHPKVRGAGGGGGLGTAIVGLLEALGVHPSPVVSALAVLTGSLIGGYLAPAT